MLVDGPVREHQTAPRRARRNPARRPRPPRGGRRTGPSPTRPRRAAARPSRRGTRGRPWPARRPTPSPRPRPSSWPVRTAQRTRTPLRAAVRAAPDRDRSSRTSSSASSPSVRSSSPAIVRTASSTPGMNDDRSYVSWRIESVWPVVPSSTSWCATIPRMRTECTRISSSTSPPRAPSATTVVVGSSPHSCDAAAIRLRGGHGGARRCVDLLVVVELDDLGGLEPRCGQLGEAHHQHRADREVGRDHRVGAACAANSSANSSRSSSD